MKTWEIVKKLEEKSDRDLRDYGESLATIVVNFGANGKNSPNIISDGDSLVQMIVKVCEFYEDRLKAQQKDSADVEKYCDFCGKTVDHIRCYDCRYAG